MKVLVIEDDKEALSYIAKGLREHGYVVDVAEDGMTGLGMANTEDYDVWVVDRMLPQLDGLHVIHTLRKAGRQTPALILSALDRVDERVKGLRAGGDDYLTKPYAFSEMLARVEALLRRRELVPQDTSLTVADLRLDRLTQKVERGGRHLILQPREYRLLEYLMRHSGQIVTRTMLLEHVWDYHFDPQTNVIDVHISRLRQKVDKGFGQELIHTVRGAGYSLYASE